MTAATVPTVSPRLRLAGGLVAVQATVAAVLVAILAYEDFTAEATELSLAVGVTAFMLLLAGTLGAIAVALWRGKGGGRGPALAVELLLLAPAYYMVTGGAAAWGWPLTVVAVTVIVLLVVPPAERGGS